jgi:hypothetical protein
MTSFSISSTYAPSLIWLAVALAVGITLVLAAVRSFVDWKLAREVRERSRPLQPGARHGD